MSIEMDHIDKMACLVAYLAATGGSLVDFDCVASAA